MVTARLFQKHCNKITLNLDPLNNQFSHTHMIFMSQENLFPLKFYSRLTIGSKHTLDAKEKCTLTAQVDHVFFLITLFEPLH